MTLTSNIDSPADAGALIRHQRMKAGMTQQALAGAAGVSRKFLIDLETGHERAELGKTLAVLTALGLSLVATSAIPRGSEHDPERRDYAATFSDLLAKKDFEFAIKMLADYASASLKAGRPYSIAVHGSRTHTGQRHWQGSQTTSPINSTELHRPGPAASTPSERHGCQPNPIEPFGIP